MVLLVQQVQDAGVQPQVLDHTRTPAQVEGDESRGPVLPEGLVDAVLLGDEPRGGRREPAAFPLPVVAEADARFRRRDLRECGVELTISIPEKNAAP